MDDLDDLIESKLKYLDCFFDHIDHKIDAIEQNKNVEFDQLNQSIENHAILNEFIITNIIDEKRENMIFKLSTHYKNTLNFLKQIENFKSIEFCESSLKLEDTSFVLGQLKYKNKFYLLKKFNYFDYIDQYLQEIKLIEDLIRFFNVRILILSPSRMFIYLRTNEGETFFKIFNHKCEEYYSIKVDPNLVYRNVLSHQSKIICLFNDPVKKHNILSVYNDDLSLVQTRVLDYNLMLCSLLDNEIICWNVSDTKCFVFDFSLNLVSSFGQLEDENEPFYFENGILIESSKELFLIYYFDKEELKHFIKIINRSSGHLTGVIHFDFNFFSKMIRIDNKSNILVKLYEPADELKYYDSNGNLLKVFRNTDLSKYNRIDLSQDDDIICYDKVEKKSFF